MNINNYVSLQKIREINGLERSLTGNGDERMQSK